MELGVYSFGDIHRNPVTREQVSPGQRHAGPAGADPAGRAGRPGLLRHRRAPPRRTTRCPTPAPCWPRRRGRRARIGLCSAVTVPQHRGPGPGLPAVRHHRPDLAGPGRADGRAGLVHRVLPAVRRRAVRLRRAVRREDPTAAADRRRQPGDLVRQLPAAAGQCGRSCPGPIRKPGIGEHLRISIATGGNPESSVRAGILGLPVNYAIIGGQPDRFAPLVDLYRRAFEHTERPGATQEVSVSGMGFVTDDGKALDRFFPYWLETDAADLPRAWFPDARTARPTRRRPRPAARTSSAPRSRSPSASWICTPQLGHDRQGFQMDLSSVPQDRVAAGDRAAGHRGRAAGARGPAAPSASCDRAVRVMNTGGAAPGLPRCRVGIVLAGSVSERPKEHASKACEGATPPWVQIPPLPPPTSDVGIYRGPVISRRQRTSGGSSLAPRRVLHREK